MLVYQRVHAINLDNHKKNTGIEPEHMGMMLGFYASNPEQIAIF